jgi:hypothetical protein
MNRFLALALPFALLAVAGCGQNLGSTPAETMKMQTDNLKEIATILNSITDAASADAALPKLESKVALQNELKKKFDGYKMSLDEAGKTIKEGGGDYMKAGLDVGLASMSASLKAGNKAEAVGKVMAKMDTGSNKPGR